MLVQAPAIIISGSEYSGIEDERWKSLKSLVRLEGPKSGHLKSALQSVACYHYEEDSDDSLVSLIIHGASSAVSF